MGQERGSTLYKHRGVSSTSITMHLMLFQISLFTLASAATIPRAFLNPYTSINEDVENRYFLKGFNGVPENLNVWVPKDGKQTEYPLILFLAGFGANMPSALYSSLVTQIVAKNTGAVVVAWDGLTVSNPLDIDGTMPHIQSVLDFCQTKLQGLIASKFNNPVRIDPKRIFHLSHSSGAQLSVLLAHQNKPKGIIFLDPVDR